MRKTRPWAAVIFAITLLGNPAVTLGGYKPKPWSPRTAESYPARLFSEKVTIALDPLFTDAAAAQVFDKKDIVTRGIMPLAVVVFNGNEFPIVVEGSNIELIREDDHIRTITPAEVVGKLFPQTTRSVLGGGGGPNRSAMDDLSHKFFGQRIVPAKETAAGFLFLRVPARKDLSEYLSVARVYIPEVSRQDTGASLIFFEIDLRPIFDAAGNAR